MKRTYTANINGQVFNIDDDAYDLLQNYFGQLHATFGGEEGVEIVADMESRVCEHFNERTGGGRAVITIADVSAVISTMGRPEDFGEAAAAVAEDGPGAVPPPFETPVESPAPKKLFRDMQNKVFGGVIGGLGVYLGWNASVMRLLLVILALCTKIFPLVIIYLIAWMIIPAAVTPAQRLRMQGKAVTPGNMGRTMASEAVAQPEDPNFWRTLFQACGKVAISLLGIAGCLVATVGSIALMVEIAGMTLWATSGSDAILAGVGIFEDVAPVLFCMEAILWTLLVVLLGAASAWLAASVVLGVRGASRATFITGTIMAVILFLAAMIISGICSAIV